MYLQVTVNGIKHYIKLIREMHIHDAIECFFSEQFGIDFHINESLRTDKWYEEEAFGTTYIWWNSLPGYTINFSIVEKEGD